MTLKMHIMYEFKTGPWGGGNQFLKALRKGFIKKGRYAENPKDAHVIIFNSHHFGDDLTYLRDLIDLKKNRPEIRLIHRLDGPVSLIRGGSKSIDNLIFYVNSKIADGTVFQTNWSLGQSQKIGLNTTRNSKVIFNAPDSDIFFSSEKKMLGSPIKLINTSWAVNERKGLDILHHLDSYLDFSFFDLTVVGNFSRCFQNIKILQPQDSTTLANTLRSHDIFIAPSINEPCSNALIEALHSGLPALYRNSGGHPELVGEGGVTFNDEKDVVDSLKTLTFSYATYRNNIKMPTIFDIADQYYDFAKELYQKNLQFETISINNVWLKTQFYSFQNRAMNAFIRRIRLINKFIKM